MTRLVDSKMVEVNERGHYRFISDDPDHKVEEKEEGSPGVIGEDYLPASETSAIIGEDYFPPPAKELGPNPDRWVSTENEQIFKKPRKKSGK